MSNIEARNFLNKEGYRALFPKDFELPDEFNTTFITVIPIRAQEAISINWIQRLFDNLETHDESGKKESTFDLDVIKDLESRGSKVAFLKCPRGEDSPVAPGVYLHENGRISSICKLVYDTQGAFMLSLIEDKVPESKPEIFNNTDSQASQGLPIAIFPKIEQFLPFSHPLAGLRIAVKDNFKIAGIKTSLCNKAYYDLYDHADDKAKCIQDLYDRGAYILGTTKLASFAATEEPLQCIDHQAPWNPRADGYQSPAGSSSGSGVAVAAYEWVDISIGSDTSGSGRRPGHWNGCIAMRPSHGLVSKDGFVESFARFDTPTFFGRDLDLCKKFTEYWYDGSYTKPLKPFSIVYPIDYMSLITNKDQLALIDRFVTDLEDFLDKKHTRVSFSDLWAATTPEEAEGESLSQFMQGACRDSFFYADYHNFDKFRKDYRAKYGRPPYISPPVRWQWELAATITPAEHDVALGKLETYRRWFTKNFMKPEFQTTLVVLPIENISPRYRDEMPEGYFNPKDVPNLFLSPILKAPELTMPIGEVPYKSKITQNTEHLPVAISLMAAPRGSHAPQGLERRAGEGGESNEGTGREGDVCARGDEGNH